MDVSGKQKDGWVNQMFRVPSLPTEPRSHYPFSKCPALIYRLKLGAVLLNLGAALCLVPEPCHRLCILFNCCLLFVSAEYVHRNYPWREPLTTWLWKFRLCFPHWGTVATLVFALLLLAWNRLGADCTLPHPLEAVVVGWCGCMLIFPVARHRWHRTATEYDYHQFSSVRPCVLTLPRPLAILYAALQSQSFLGLLAISLGACVPGLFLHGWLLEAWTVAATTFLLACFALLCSHGLPEHVSDTLLRWKAEEEAYALKIETEIRKITTDFQVRGVPSENSDDFRRLIVQVPLLQREVDIMVKESRNMTDDRKRELSQLATAPEMQEIRRICDGYGPYTTQCCIS